MTLSARRPAHCPTAVCPVRIQAQKLRRRFSEASILEEISRCAMVAMLRTTEIPIIRYRFHPLPHLAARAASCVVSCATRCALISRAVHATPSGLRPASRRGGGCSPFMQTASCMAPQPSPHCFNAHWPFGCTYSHAVFPRVMSDDSAAGSFFCS